MSEITTNNGEEHLPSTANAFMAAGSELSGSALPILKLTKDGRWVSGTDNVPITESRFAADVNGALRGYVCFVDGEVVDERMLPVALGKQVSRDELQDHGPCEGTDGWKPSASIQLRGIETGEQYVFRTTSLGGREAIGGLLSKYGYRMDIGKGGVPIIDLGETSYDHKRYGKVHKPLFRIVSWQTETDLVARSGEKLKDELLDDSVPF